MKAIYQKIILIAVAIFALQFATYAQNGHSGYTKIEPAHLDDVEGSDFKSITLSEKAAERIGIKTAPVMEEKPPNRDAALQKVVPYASVLYDAYGKTWVFKSLKSHSYIRHEIVIDFIDDNKVFLLEGPSTGTPLVIQGTSELYGTESKVGH